MLLFTLVLPRIPDLQEHSKLLYQQNGSAVDKKKKTLQREEHGWKKGQLYIKYGSKQLQGRVCLGKHVNRKLILQWLLHNSQDRVTGMNRDSVSLGATETKYQFTFGN